MWVQQLEIWIENFNDFLLSKGGYFCNWVNNPEQVESISFKPEQEKQLPFIALLAVITDPVVLLIYVAERVLLGVFELFHSLVNISVEDRSDAADNVTQSGVYLREAMISFCCMIISPVVNFIDFLKKVHNSFKQTSSDDNEITLIII
ncbi:MAG TPA: hypothetical protein PK657_07035 [Legionella sp.]|nr:hypothetical protein [Legionella sp.]